MTPQDLPELRRPVLVAAFGGWNDAGDAASTAIEHLALTWDATDLYDIDPDDYYDYQSARPTVHQAGGVMRRLEWPSAGISYCRVPGGTSDLVLVLGVEPNFRWRTFCQEIIDMAFALNVERVVTLGSLLADTPHTRPVPITGSAYNSEAVTKYGFAESKYEGPTGITGVLNQLFIQAGVPAISLWASVPHYLGHPPNPKATLALLNRLEAVLDTPIPLGMLPAQTTDWEESINEMLADDEDMANYVRELEERALDEQNDAADQLTEVDGDTLAAEFERYLRGRGPAD
ncbi:MAG: PAC2 family protein [Gordonia sp. (in: high G+C Gram-positive bacteria)]|uniref:PAC2 family protein n=1 Tax=Gordonia sp. (in: high G+C Gram-positive bacteria) TaxID=84139 RepID=UPI003BB7D5DE